MNAIERARKASDTLADYLRTQIGDAQALFLLGEIDEAINDLEDQG